MKIKKFRLINYNGKSPNNFRHEKFHILLIIDDFLENFIMMLRDKGANQYSECP